MSPCLVSFSNDKAWWTSTWEQKRRIIMRNWGTKKKTTKNNLKNCKTKIIFFHFFFFSRDEWYLRYAKKKQQKIIQKYAEKELFFVVFFFQRWSFTKVLVWMNLKRESLCCARRFAHRNQVFAEEEHRNDCNRRACLAEVKSRSPPERKKTGSDFEFVFFKSMF